MHGKSHISTSLFARTLVLPLMIAAAGLHKAWPPVNTWITVKANVMPGVALMHGMIHLAACKSELEQGDTGCVRNRRACRMHACKKTRSPQHHTGHLPTTSHASLSLSAKSLKGHCLIPMLAGTSSRTEQQNQLAIAIPSQFSADNGLDIVKKSTNPTTVPELDSRMEDPRMAAFASRSASLFSSRPTCQKHA